MRIFDKIARFLKRHRHLKEMHIFTASLSESLITTIAAALLVGLSSIPTQAHAAIQVRPLTVKLGVRYRLE